MALVAPAAGVRRIKSPEELAGVVALLEEAKAWTAGVGQPIWADEVFTLEDHQALAAAGEVFGGFVQDHMVASFRLQRTDPIHWPEDPPGEALYLHKVVVARSAAGQGWSARLVRWAAAQAMAEGASNLRLDTLPDGPLPGLYRDLGLRAVTAAPEHLGGRWVLRMELGLDRRQVQSAAMTSISSNQASS